MSPQERATEVQEHKKQSHDWLNDTFYGEWERAYKAYKCQRDAVIDPNTGKVDPTRISVATPNVWASVNRETARITAQGPNLRYHCDDKRVGEEIGLTLMWQWDRGEVQKLQKKHVRQASLLGWSVRAWSWERCIQTRKKRVDVFDPMMPQEGLAAIADHYQKELGQILGGAPQDPRALVQVLSDPQMGPLVRAKLLALKGRGNLLPIAYDYLVYEGPRADFLFVGDCYPQPYFQNIQKSKWFCVERRRDREWLERLAKAYPEQMADGVGKLLQEFPNGSQRRFWGSGDSSDLRWRLLKLHGSQDQSRYVTDNKTGEWTITEEHVPGRKPKLTLVGEESTFLGEIEYPYDLDGKIAFTECVLIDDLLQGIGDSTPRILGGIYDLHSTMVSLRAQIYDQQLRPLMGTADLAVYNNPGRIKAGPGMRLVWMPMGRDGFFHIDTSSMLNAATASQAEEAALMRMIQMATGESNVSMMAGVDPQQGRTATGAKILQRNLDAVTRDKIDAMTQGSVNADAEMMFLLNRSEMSDAAEFDGTTYDRGERQRAVMENRRIKERWVKLEPLMFQRDGRIVVEAGSTLADDDEAKVEQAGSTYMLFRGNPLVNQRKIVADVLIAQGKGQQVDEYLEQGPPAGAEPPEPPVNASLSVKTDLAALPPAVQIALLKGTGMPEPDGPGAQSGPGGAPGMMSGANGQPGIMPSPGANGAPQPSMMTDGGLPQ
jgi:hypothetical protein